MKRTLDGQTKVIQVSPQSSIRVIRGSVFFVLAAAVSSCGADSIRDPFSPVVVDGAPRDQTLPVDAVLDTPQPLDNGLDASLPPDVPPSPDVPADSDTSVPPDAPTSSDVPTIPDVPVTLDVPADSDASVPPDAPTSSDVPTTPDVPVTLDVLADSDASVPPDAPTSSDVPTTPDVLVTLDVPADSDASVPPDAPTSSDVPTIRDVPGDSEDASADVVRDVGTDATTIITNVGSGEVPRCTRVIVDGIPGCLPGASSCDYSIAVGGCISYRIEAVTLPTGPVIRYNWITLLRGPSGITTTRPVTDCLVPNVSPSTTSTYPVRVNITRDNIYYAYPLSEGRSNPCSGPNLRVIP